MNKLIYILKRWQLIIMLTIVIRLVLLIFSLLVNPETNIVSSWIRWDGPHYIDIARNWYQTSGDPVNFIVFYPFYPMLIKLLSFFINPYLSAIIISVFFSFTASIILFELTLLDFNKRIAVLSVWFMNIFPTAYFLQAAYTESIFLTMSLATIYLYRKKSFILSGLTGALASMTRINGILLLPLLIMESKTFGKNLITLILTPVGFLFYLLINYLIFNDPLFFSKILSSHWYKHFEFPWISITNLIHFFQNQTGNYYYLFLSELFTIFLLCIITILVFLKVRKSYGVYMFFNLLLFTSTNFIMSTPRYALSLFPIFILLALIKNKFLLILVSSVSAILLFLLESLYIQGGWAF